MSCRQLQEGGASMAATAGPPPLPMHAGGMPPLPMQTAYRLRTTLHPVA